MTAPGTGNDSKYSLISRSRVRPRLERGKKRVSPTVRKLLYDFSVYLSWIITGVKGFGKSAFMEQAVERYVKKGFLVFDLYDSGDMESCFWVVRRCPNPVHPGQVPLRYDEDACPLCGMEPATDYRILFVYPDEVTIRRVADPRIAVIPANAGLEAIVEQALAENRIITLASGLFDETELDYLLTNWIIQWRLLNRDVFRVNAVFLIREAASVIFAKRRERESQKYLKTALETFYRRARHVRTCIFFDTQSHTSVDIEFRRITERMIIKKQNRGDMNAFVRGINDRIKEDRKAMFKKGKKRSVVNNKRPEIPYLRNNEFYAVFPDGKYYLKRNGLPSFYHKTERDYFVDLVGMEFDQPAREFNPKNAINSIRDVPKRVLLELNAFLAQEEVDAETRANLFQRKPSTVKKWVEDYHDLLDNE